MTGVKPLKNIMKTTARDRTPVRWAVAMAISLISFYSILWAQAPDAGIDIIAFHAQRYQEFTQGKINCEVFGEIKNNSDRELRGVTVSVDFLDKKGKVVAHNEMALVLRVIAPRKPKGEARPVKTGEIGIFSQDSVQCPDTWLEGRINYKVKKADWK